MSCDLGPRILADTPFDHVSIDVARAGWGVGANEVKLASSLIYDVDVDLSADAAGSTLAQARVFAFGQRNFGSREEAPKPSVAISRTARRPTQAAAGNHTRAFLSGPSAAMAAASIPISAMVMMARPGRDSQAPPGAKSFRHGVESEPSFVDGAGARGAKHHPQAREGLPAMNRVGQPRQERNRDPSDNRRKKNPAH
jgi:hypothetical protein